MRINKFKKLSGSKYKIFFDNNTLTIYEDVIIKYNLLYKKEIDSDLLIEINKDNYKAGIYDTAIKYIGVRMRSIKEMHEYLIKKGYEEVDVNSTVERLIANGLLNDTLFSKSYTNDKLNLTNDGPNKIRKDLLNLGVNEEIINNTLSEIDKELITDKLNKIIDKTIKVNSKMPLIKLRNKVINRCANLGYNYEDINNIMDNVNLKSTSDIKKEYEKLYMKYSKKYDGYKLETFIKSKLYQKGYSSEEINNIVK